MQVEHNLVATAMFKVSRQELSGPGVALVSVALLAAATWMSVQLSDRLGLFFGIAVVLAAITAALVVDDAGLFMAGVLPPLLLVGTTVAAVAMAPQAVAAADLARDADAASRVVAGVVDHATALVIGHVAALTIIGARIRGASPV